MDEITRLLEQRLASLEQDARQLCLTMEADGPADARPRERTEGAATVVQAMHEDSFSASRVDPGPKTNLTSLGVKAQPSAFHCRDDVLVDNGAAAPKSCFLPLEVSTTSAAGGLLPTTKTYTATKTTFNQPPLWLYLTEETNLWASILSAWYASTFRRNILLAALLPEGH